jgi:hypothetical protein
MRTIYSRMQDQSRRKGKVGGEYDRHQVDLRPKVKVEPALKAPDPDVELHRVARVVHDFPLKYIVRNAGTIKCDARFQMTKVQAAIVRKHFGIKPEDPIQFCTSEVTAMGPGGWYTAFSMTDKVDEALKAILNIKSALYHDAHGLPAPHLTLPPAMEQLKAKQEPARQVPSVTVRTKEPTVAKPVYHIRKVVVRTRLDEKGRPVKVAIDRHAQAEQNKPTGDKALAEKIQHLMQKQPPATLPEEKLVNTVEALRAHFGK